MTATAEEVEVTAVHAPGAEIVPRAGAAVQAEEYRPRILMQPDEAKAMDEQLRKCMLAVLREGIDYGTIPGAGDKKNLLKPGAEKLLQWFGFGFSNDEVKTERDDPDHPTGIADKARRVGVTYRCTVTKAMPDGREVVVATCEGYAGFDEDRYWISEDDAKSKAEKAERKWAAKDNREPKPAKWMYAAEYRAPWNTLVKMAQKRSLVGAAINATAASGLFTQDMEDAGPAEPDTPKFGDVAMAALRALDKPVLEAVGRWYRGQRWPDPRDWDAEQWCAALQAAGFFAGRQAAATPAAADEAPPAAADPAARDADAPQDTGSSGAPEAGSAAEAFDSAGPAEVAHAPRDASEPEVADEARTIRAGNAAAAQWERPWPDWAMEQAGQAAGEAACGKLWKESAAKARAGEITEADARRVQDALTARVDALRTAEMNKLLALLPEEDNWRAKAEELDGEESARAALAELGQLVTAGKVDVARANRISRAITARWPKARAAAQQDAA